MRHVIRKGQISKLFFFPAELGGETDGEREKERFSLEVKLDVSSSIQC